MAFFQRYEQIFAISSPCLRLKMHFLVKFSRSLTESISIWKSNEFKGKGNILLRILPIQTFGLSNFTKKSAKKFNFARSHDGDCYSLVYVRSKVGI